MGIPDEIDEAFLRRLYTLILEATVEDLFLFLAKNRWTGSGVIPIAHGIWWSSRKARNARLPHEMFVTKGHLKNRKLASAGDLAQCIIEITGGQPREIRHVVERIGQIKRWARKRGKSSS